MIPGGVVATSPLPLMKSPPPPVRKGSLLLRRLPGRGMTVVRVSLLMRVRLTSMSSGVISTASSQACLVVGAPAGGVHEGGAGADFSPT